MTAILPDQWLDLCPLLCRKYVGKQLGQGLTAVLREVVKKFDASLDGEYSPDAESAAKRTLKNKALQMLSSSGDTAVSKELLTRFRDATNMTDTIAALTALIDSEGKALCPKTLWESLMLCRKSLCYSSSNLYLRGLSSFLSDHIHCVQ